MYLSFIEFMKLRRYPINETLFRSDKMYRAKKWKVHAKEYKRLCEKRELFNDYEQLNEEVLTYEAKVKNLRSTVHEVY